MKTRRVRRPRIATLAEVFAPSHLSDVPPPSRCDPQRPLDSSGFEAMLTHSSLSDCSVGNTHTRKESIVVSPLPPLAPPQSVTDIAYSHANGLLHGEDQIGPCLYPDEAE
ncbi:unnamed protein product, partial [Protopolystoma xenopodis]